MATAPQFRLNTDQKFNCRLIEPTVCASRWPSNSLPSQVSPNRTELRSPCQAIPARSLARLAAGDVGAEVALLFEEGDRMRPLIVGKLVEPARDDAAPLVVADGQMVRLTAKERIELRVGRSSIIMEADGHITIRGTDLVSHAARSNRIRGGSVNLN